MNNKEERENKYNIYGYNLFDIFFVKNKNNYNIYCELNNVSDVDTNRVIINNKDKINLLTPIMYIPFGSERYRYNNILNIEFSDLNNDKEMYQFYNMINRIDNFFIRFSCDKDIIKQMNNNDGFNIQKSLYGKVFLSSIRTIKNGYPLLRTYIKSNKKTFYTSSTSEAPCKSDEENNIKYITYKNIKSMYGKFILHLGSLWISYKNYGLIWYIEEGSLI